MTTNTYKVASNSSNLMLVVSFKSWESYLSIHGQTNNFEQSHEELQLNQNNISKSSTVIQDIFLQEYQYVSKNQQTNASDTCDNIM